ncbi:MAG: DUF262 domain-containing HNH endonuclease family protein [Candidatus Bathyarchaeia archaeon]
MKIDANVKHIENLKDFFFEVPDYQREFVWQAEKHVAQFLDDIYAEFLHSNSQESHNYFIGSVIAVKRADGASEVIDGQQRLTTIMIALCALRDYIEENPSLTNLSEDEQNFRNEILKKIKDLLYEFSIRDEKRRPRLTLQYEDSRDYLAKLIEGKTYQGDETNSIKRMKEAYSTIYNFIKRMDSKTLNSFMKYFMVNVEMVFIEPDNISSALKIFETINQRGVGLNAMDLLKNLVFRQARAEDFKVIKEKWQRITKELEKCSEGDRPLRFLRYFMMAKYYDGILREDEIYNWVISDEGKKRIKYNEKPIDFVEELLRSAEKYSRYVTATASSKEDRDYPHLTRIGQIGRVNFRQHLILLLAMDDKLGSEGIELLCKQLETLILYYVITREPIRDFERKFSTWAKELRDIHSIEDLRTFIRNKFLPEITERDNRFKQEFLRLAQSDITPLYRIKYMLGRIEEYIREKCNMPRQSLEYYQRLELEHTLPQTPDEKSLSDAIKAGLFKDEREYYSYVYYFGNLTLVESVINRALNNVNKISQQNWFDNKLAEYKKSEALITSSIAGYAKIGKDTALNTFMESNLKSFNEWNKKTIEDRQLMLFELARNIWKIDA